MTQIGLSGSGFEKVADRLNLWIREEKMIGQLRLEQFGQTLKVSSIACGLEFDKTVRQPGQVNANHAVLQGAIPIRIISAPLILYTPEMRLRPLFMNQDFNGSG